MCRCEPTSPRPGRLLGRVLLAALALAAVLAAAAVARAQDVTPLKPGDELPGPFRPWAFTGKHVETLRRRILNTIRETDDEGLKQEKKARAAAIRGMYHDPLSENGLNPLVLVFVHGADASPAVLQLLEKLDAAVARHERERLGAAVVFLHPDVAAHFQLPATTLEALQAGGLPAETVKKLDELKDKPFDTRADFVAALGKDLSPEELEKYQARLISLARTSDLVAEDPKRDAAVKTLEPKVAAFQNLTCAVDSQPMLDDYYQLSPKDEVTVIVANKLRVLAVKSVAAGELDEKAVDALVKEVDDKVGALSTPPAEKKPGER